MEESINPTINIGPVTFDLTLTALTLLSVFLIFAFIYWQVVYDLETQR